MVVINWQLSDIIVQSGKQRENKINMLSREKCFNLITLQLAYYETTDGITGVWDSYTREMILGPEVESLNVGTVLSDVKATWFTFLVNPIVKRYIRYPTTIVTALSRIGGLFALFKIGILLLYVHEKMFEKEFQRRHHGHNADASSINQE